MTSSLAGLFLLTALVGGSALAAQPLPSVDQIAPPASAALDQLSDGSTEILSPPRDAAPRIITPQQLDGAGRRAAQATQLTSERSSGRAPAQVSTGGRSAQGATALSRPGEGRRVAVERVAGDDRCDPSRRAVDSDKKCAAVIENRAAEFAAPAPAPLSPEERILLEQRRRAAATGSRTATRRLAESGNAETPELQGIASVVLRDPEPRSARPTDEVSASERAAAIIEAVINQGGINAPPPQ